MPDTEATADIFRYFMNNLRSEGGGKDVAKANNYSREETPFQF